MLYFRLNAAGQVAAYKVDRPEPCPAPTEWAHQPGRATLGKGWCNRNDFDTMAVAEMIAASASENLGAVFYATDAGPNCSPQYDVIEAPKIGAPVSYAFNGDSYPCGKIAKISETGRVITTDEGKVFYRRNLTGAWVMSGGTWYMVAGHVKAYNREF